MPILPKGNSKRSLGPNFVNDSGKVSPQTLGSLVDFSFADSPTIGAVLHHSGQFSPVFGWEVDGVHLNDIAPLTSALPNRMGGKAA